MVGVKKEIYKGTSDLHYHFVMYLFHRASDDLNNNMVAVDTMEQFQKELDQAKVSGMLQSRSRRLFSS